MKLFSFRFTLMTLGKVWNLPIFFVEQTKFFFSLILLKQLVKKKENSLIQTSFNPLRNGLAASCFWYRNCLVWFGWVLWHINHCMLWNAKFSLLTEECCEQYWTSPGSNTLQGTNYSATCVPSLKLSKLDEPDMQDTGEAGLVWFLCLMAYQLFLGYLMPKPFS